MIEDLRAFLRHYARPAHQYDIIRSVGEIRRKRYPDLLRPYNDVWKSLQYHNQHKQEIIVVDWVGERLRPAKLKMRPKAKRVVGGQEDSAEFYRSPDNLFWFIDEIKTFRGKRVKHNPIGRFEESTFSQGDPPAQLVS